MIMQQKRTVEISGFNVLVSWSIYTYVQIHWLVVEINVVEKIQLNFSQLKSLQEI